MKRLNVLEILKFVQAINFTISTINKISLGYIFTIYLSDLNDSYTMIRSKGFFQSATFSSLMYLLRIYSYIWTNASSRL